MQPGDLLVTALVTPLPEGPFPEHSWPLHVTIVAWFRTPALADAITHSLAQRLKDIAPFDVHMSEEARLGYGGRALVNLVRQPTPFIDIQQRTIECLKAFNTDFVTGTGTWDEAYKPHVTVQKNGRLHAGDQWKCDQLYVVEATRNGNRIVGEVPLHG